MIKRCNCKNSYQDKKHGKGMRVFNPLGKGKQQNQQYRCTICLIVK